MKPLGRKTIYSEQKSNETRINQAERRAPVAGFYEIKVFADDEAVTSGNGAFTFAIPIDLSGSELRSAAAFVSTVSASGGPILVMIHNDTQNQDMLSVRISIDDGEFTSYTAATDAEIDITANEVVTGDLIRIDVDDAGSGAMGLGVMLGFS